MKISDITSTLEAFAPLELQERYDNSGLLVGSPETEIGSALVCVDVSDEVMDEAVEVGANIIISHHPLIFSPLRRLTGATRAERLVARAIRENVAIYACHTNLDAAGMSLRLAEEIGLRDIAVLDAERGFGVIGQMPTPEKTEDFLRRVGARRYSDITSSSEVRTVALCTGAGEDLIPAAVERKAEIFLTSDIRHHNFLDSAGVITIVDMGHYESEKCSIGLILDIISEKFPTFAIRPSASERNPVNYLL